MKIEDAGFPAPVLVEAKDDTGSIWRVALIASGTSANQNNYQPQVLEKAAPLFEGVRALARSDEEHIQDREKSVKNIVGWFENVQYVGGKILADFHISEAAAWLKTMLKDAWDQGKKDLIGFSIVAEGRGKIKRTKKGMVRVVESIISVSSVDVVVNPAAGGRILKLVAAQNNTNMEDLEIMEKLLKLLETNAPEVYAKIDQENITEPELEALLAEAMKPAETPPAASNDVDPPKTESDDANKLALAEAKRLHEEVTEKLKIAECKSVLTEGLAASGLPELAKARIKRDLAGKVFEEKTLTEAIDFERSYLAKMSESGRISGLGGTRIDVGPDEQAKTLKALDGFFANSDQKDGDHVIPRFRSFREAYIAITGDKELTGRIKEATNLHRFTEALDSGSWAEILGDSITRRMIAEYNVPGLSDWQKIISDRTRVNDFRTYKRMRMGGYGALPAVAEGGPYDNLTSPIDEEATYSISKYGGLETLTIEMIANDDMGAIRRIPRKLARTAAIGLYRFVFDFIKDNPNTTYDATALFHADHNNLGSAALSATSLLAAKILMAGQTGYGTANDILGLVPKYLLVPSELEDIAFILTTSRSSIGSAESTPRYTDTEPNIHATYGLEVILVPYWTDANDWVLICNTADCPTFEIGFFQGREEPELFTQDQPTSGSMFTADKITYKIRHIYGGAILDHRGMYKAVVA